MAQKGRKKNVVSGSASVHKRGSGLGTGPVGRADGYSGRTGGSGKVSSGGSERGYSGSTTRAGSGAGIFGLLSLLKPLMELLKKNKTARMIAIVLVVCVIAYFIFGGNCSMCSMGDYSDFSTYGVAGLSTTEQNADLSVSNLARDKRTNIKGDGRDTFTIMVYMCGSDLESKYGMATADLKEMITASKGDNVRVIVETGGANKWQNSTVDSSTNQIYRVTDKGLQHLSNVGKKKMTDPNTLTSFIQFCTEHYPADRYGLIMWDHGGGSISGFGYDEGHRGDSMTLDEINTALKNSGCVFDFIGFDACLMATLETALVMEKYSDYLIASEETEPGIGWYYTNWLTKLSANTSMSTVEIGKNIIDDFVVMCQQASPNDKMTLSIIDLAELAGTVPEAFTDFAVSTNELVETDNYKQVSDARSATREFSSGINQVDLIDLCERIGTNESKEFAKVLRGCVKYNRTSKNIANANGVSIYFPYGKSSSMTSALSTYDKIGLDDTYSECIKSFASVSAGGQIASGTGGSLLDSLFGGSTTTTAPSSGGSLIDLIGMLGGSNTGTSSGSSNADLIGTALSTFLGSSNSSSLTGIDVGQFESWFNRDLVTNSTAYYQENYLDPDRVVITTAANGERIVDLTEEEWALVQDIQLNVFVEDEDGYIDLGMDNVYEQNDDGDLIFTYDNTWLTIDGHAVSYYMISCDTSGDNYVITGRVPAMLNGELVDIILVFDNENPNGVVAGARKVYSGETQTIQRGLIEIKSGDVIDFLCDHYAFDKSFDDAYYLGEQYIADDELTIANMDIGTANKLVTYCLTDIYGNEIWTDAVVYAS